MATTQTRGVSHGILTQILRLLEAKERGLARGWRYSHVEIRHFKQVSYSADLGDSQLHHGLSVRLPVREDESIMLKQEGVFRCWKEMHQRSSLNQVPRLPRRFPHRE